MPASSASAESSRRPTPNRSDGHRSRAERDAVRARNRAVRSSLLRALRGLPTRPIPFEAVRALRPRNESYRGVRAIEIARIVGSVDRHRDFTRRFDPRPALPLDRWIGIRVARLGGTELPAIEVYQVGEVYFIRDGHHRVAVARDAGQRFIDAEIIELRVPVPPEPDDTEGDLAHKAAYAAFLDATDLAALAPGHAPIRPTDPARYRCLLEHIGGHRWLLGARRGHEVGWSEAVASWHASVYRPLVDALRAGDLPRAFPGRSDADLYLWLTDHRWFLTERAGREVAAVDAVVDYARRYAPSPLGRLWRRARHALGATWRGRRAAR